MTKLTEFEENLFLKSYIVDLNKLLDSAEATIKKRDVKIGMMTSTIQELNDRLQRQGLKKNVTVKKLKEQVRLLKEGVQYRKTI